MNRRFLTIWFGQVVSQFGTSLSGFGASLWVYVETGSIGWLAVMVMAATLPPLLTLPFSGAVDRFDRRVVMLAADTAAALVTACVVGVWMFGTLHPWHLLVSAFLGGLFGAFQNPAYAAALPDLTGGKRLDRANGLVQLGPSLAVIAAPGVAALLIAGPGIGSVFLIDLATFGVGVTSLLAVRFQSVAAAAEGDSVRLGDAAQWVVSHAKEVGYLIGVVAIVNLMLATVNLSILVRGADLGGTARAGVAPTVGGIGMIVTSLWIGARGLSGLRMSVVAWATAALGFFMMLAVARPSFPLFVICVGLGIATGPAARSAIATTMHELVPQSMQGRVFSLRNAAAFGAHPLGAAIAGPLAGWPVTGAMTIAGAALVLVGATVRVNRRFTSLNTALPLP